jgi:hypothetical protein
MRFPDLQVVRWLSPIEEKAMLETKFALAHQK